MSKDSNINSENLDKNDNQTIGNKRKDKVKQVIQEIDLFKKLSIDNRNELIEHSELVSYSIGQPLATTLILQDKVLIILQGSARVMGLQEGNLATIGELGNGSVVGLSSLLLGTPCEEISAKTEVIALSITDKYILQLYKTEKYFRDFCHNNIFPGEISKLSSFLIEKSPRTDISMKSSFNNLLRFTKVKEIKENRSIEVQDNEIIFAVSSNINGKEFGDIIETNIQVGDNYLFQPRFLAIPRELYNEFMQHRKDNLNIPKDEDKIDDNIITPSKDFPYKSTLDFDSYNNKKKNKLIRANGELQEALAVLNMIANELEIPFRKDSIEKILRDAFNSKGKINLDTVGGLLSVIGLYARKVQLKSKFGSRLPTPVLTVWKNTLVIIQKSNNEGITIASPREGLKEIPLSNIEENFPDGFEIITFDKSNLTPNKNFNLNWFLPSLKKFQSSLILVLVASFVVQLFGLANPLLIQVIIDKVISQRSLDTLQVLGIALVFVTILGGILGSLRTFLFAETTNRIDTRLGAEVIDHLLRLPLNYFDRRPVGELGSRVGELEKIREFLTGQALTTILDAAFSIIYIIVMLLYSLTLTIVALGVVPIQILLTLLGSPLLRKQIREIARRNASTQSHLVEVLTGVQTVKAQNIETISRWKWQDLYGKYISRSFEKTITSTALSQTSTVLQQLSQLLVLWIGATLVLQGKLTLGQLIAFRIISGYVTQPLLRLSSIWQSIQELKVSFERLADIIDTPEESSDADKANIPLPEIKGNVIFDNVSFQFNKHTPEVLKNINLTIPKGTFIGIAGQSGSGKSTLMKLLPRLYSIDKGKGRILIDDYDASKVELYSLRRQIGIVPQEPLLFAGTVSENIAITDPGVNSNEIVKAAKIADAHDFIMDLPDGYSTNVGERGAGLSGGQKQRIAIARTLMNNPKLLIMDEATSALDYETEKNVCENLRLSSQNITVFFITHRLSTIKNADQIIMMHNGTISEVGTHSELLDLKGRYFALFRQQEGN